VLADPPYDTDRADVEHVLAALCGGWLRPDAVVVVERPTRDGAFEWPPGLVAHRQTAYGQTTLWYGRGAPEREDP
jgi:16S rRNA (guanine966-N2)-methyltransferase